MKFLVSQLSYFFRIPEAQRNTRSLLKFVAVLLVTMAIFSILFHFIALREGQEHSWLSGFYWTIVTMTTLGFGDITFESDLGRMFSVVVLLSGVLFLLVMLPFTFIQFFYAPWLEAQKQTRAPRELPEAMSGHVVIAYRDPVAVTLMEALEARGHPYVLLQPDFQKALEYSDLGTRVMVGSPENLDSYRAARVERAALVVANGNDYQNTNIAFTVREITETVPIIATVRDEESFDIVELSGATHLLRLADLLGESLARRTLGGEVRASKVGEFADLIIAEAPAAGTPLVGKTIAGIRLREVTGVMVVGIWERGKFSVPGPHTTIGSHTVLVLAGTERQFEHFDALFCIYNAPDDPVLILGGGRVGRAAARTLAERGIDYRIVEQDPARVKDSERYVLGSAADRQVLERAGIRGAPSTLVTTHDDAANIYLSIYCRKLRPDMQVVARATMERNVATLHRAGADFVMSYASMGANAVLNVLEREGVLMLAEGLDVFRAPVPDSLAGRTLTESGIRERTGCSVIGIEDDGHVRTGIDPQEELPRRAELVLIGTSEGERAFMETFGQPPDRRTSASS